MTPASAVAARATFEVVHGWPRLADGHLLGETMGVGVDSRGRVFVFHRARRTWTDPFPTDRIAAPTIAVFDAATGTELAHFGAALFVMPHSLTVGPDDDLWVTDVGLHQVLRLTDDGRLLGTLGTPGVPGSGPAHFAQPTDVAFARDGSSYVSDGYGNARVAKFSPAGRFVGEFGSRGAGDGQLDLPHGIALDDEGRVYVADRGNSRIQVFGHDGRWLSEWKSEALGRPYGVAIGNDGKAYVVDGGDQPVAPPDRSRAFRLATDGTIEASFGRFGNYDGEFRMAHAIAVDADGAAYVVDGPGRRVQKFIPR